MNNKKNEYFRKKLLDEKKRVNDLLRQMKDNDVYNNAAIASELSYYDNHPGDLGTEIFDIEKGRALKSNEISILRKIESALEAIENGEYGICKLCGKKINEERLEFIPYAEYCIECQNNLSSLKPHKDRPVEEEVLGNPFGYGYNDFTDDVGFDAEDSYQAVEKFNRMNNIDEFYDGDDDYVEPIESISNQEYKSQLPD